MKSSIFVFPFLMLISACAQEQAPYQTSSVGNVERLPEIASEFVETRPIDVWLPRDYPAQAPYAVLYMHDGQNLFDANTTWNKQEWRLDEVGQQLIDEQKVKPFIVVGVHNSGETRYPEYMPQKPFENQTEIELDTFRSRNSPWYYFGLNFGDKPFSDAYLKFLVTELKPYIDGHYSVSPKAEDTVISGSSMGGLISWYAVTEYPEVFGAAGCFSTHWPGDMSDEPNNPFPREFLNHIENKAPANSTHRLYFDYGSEGIDAMYEKHQVKVDALLKAKGFDASRLLTRSFPGAEHNEKAWASRLDKALEFLLPP